MRLNIFSRFIIAYLAVFVPVTGVNIYNIIQLRQFTNETYHILDIDNRITDYEKKLADSILSQARYERKYIIIKDDALYDQFLLAKIDFDRYFDEAMSLSDTPQKKGLFRVIKYHLNRYQSLFDREVEYLRTDKHYPQKQYRQEKEKALGGIMNGLKKLRADTQQDTYDKIRRLGDAGSRTSRLGVVMVVAAFFCGIIIALFITRSITKPLHRVISKTRDISGGVFKGDLRLSSPPEIGELAQSFNFMCDKLRVLDRMKSDFFSSMSHELRTPLASIKEATNLLLEGITGETTEKQKRLLTIIAEESNRLIGLVNSLLDLSKMEAGMMTLVFVDTDIDQLITKSVLEIEPLCLAKGIKLGLDKVHDLPSIKIDSERILQVLRNIIGNAMKFTPNGGRVFVSSRLINGNIEVRVSDTGPGIPEENLATIFDRFQQASVLGSSEIKGTGLGLAIVKHIITAHGGRVWAESTLGNGSSFVFLLPV
ncbi:MAG: HAMP domain-containing sensor histidine kinase [Thermodesulfobacteriota bacterium]